MSYNTKKKYALIINILYFALIIGLLYLVFKYALGYVAPFIIAAIVSMMLHPLIKWLSVKMKVKGRGIGVVVTILFWVLALAVLSLLLYLITREAAQLLSNIPSLTKSITDFANTVEEWIAQLYSRFSLESSPIFNMSLDSLTTGIVSYATGFAGRIVTFAADIAKGLPSVLLFCFAMVLSSIFISSDYDNIRNFIQLQMPSKFYSRYIFFKKFIIGTIGKYVKAYGIIMAITLSELLTAFYILGIEYAFILAVVIMIFDVLPYVGCGTVLLPWAVIDLLLGNYKLGIGLLIAAAVIGIVRNIVEPKIVGKQIGIHPLVVLISIYVGGKVLGVFGIFLFPVAVIFIKAMKDEGYIKAWKNLKERQETQVDSPSSDGRADAFDELAGEDYFEPVREKEPDDKSESVNKEEPDDKSESVNKEE